MASSKGRLHEDICTGCRAKLTYVGKHGETLTRVIGVEYTGTFDGISEWQCPDCGQRQGRWSGKVLGPDEFEERYGGQF
jgi:hypothetical protein